MFSLMGDDVIAQACTLLSQAPQNLALPSAPPPHSTWRYYSRGVWCCRPQASGTRFTVGTPQCARVHDYYARIVLNVDEAPPALTSCMCYDQGESVLYCSDIERAARSPCRNQPPFPSLSLLGSWDCHQSVRPRVFQHHIS